MTLRPRLIGIAAGALMGAAAGAMALLLVYGASAELRIEMDRDHPVTARGFYSVERGNGKSFAWTGHTAEIGWPGLDRRTPWACTVSVLGWRPATAPLPTVHFAADGEDVFVWPSRGGDDAVRFVVPARPESVGLVLTVTVAETFRPADDPRDLGVAIDRISCRPAPGHRAMPSWSALGRAAVSAAALGAALGAVGLGWPVAVVGALLIAAAQAAPLSAGFAPYVSDRPPVVLLSVGFALATTLVVLGLELVRRGPLSGSARFVVALSAVLCYLKLLVLLHPDMPTMDALMQAHRLEWVMSGRYYFTNLTPDGYAFPYGISLYLISAPFASVIRDHVALLRGVVCIAEMLAGLSLYAMVSRTWRDRAVAVIAVILFHTTPIAAAVVGTGNLTNAFGESAGLLTIATVVLLPLAWPAWVWLLVPMLIASVAFIAHLSTLMVLSMTLCAIGLLYVVAGGHTLHRVASWILMGLGLAMTASVLMFYGHFWSTYRSQAARMAGDVRTIVSPTRQTPPQTPRTTPAPAPPEQQATPPTARPRPRRPQPPAGERFAALGRRARLAYGWILPAVAALGLVVLVRRRVRDRLSLAVAAWFVTLLGCSALAVFTPLELRYQLAVAPAFAILGGVAAAAWWRAGGWRRWTIAALVAMIVVAGSRNWFEWIL